MAKHETIRRLNQTATRYHLAQAIPDEVAKRLLGRLDYVKVNPSRILDLGAGTGALSRILQKRYPKAEIMACDIAIERMRIAHKKRPWFSKLRYCAADAHALPFANHSMDLIVSNLCIHQLDLKAAFQELYRVLKPGGLLMFSTLGPDTLKELRASFAALDELPHVDIFLDMHDVGDALVNQGFADPVMDVERIYLHYASFEALIHELKNMGSINLHPERHKGLRARTYWQRLKSHYASYCQNDKWPVSAEVVFGHAFGSAPRTEFASESGEVRVNISSIKKRSPHA